MADRSVDACLAQARAMGLARLDAQLLLGHVLEKPRTWLLSHGEATVAAAAVDTFDALCRRRSDGEPVAYLLGRREFFGLDLHITPAVLDPRPDTEILVEWAIACLRRDHPAGVTPDVVDLGTGSGAIALAVKSAVPEARVWAVDRSAPAVAVARDNAQRLGLAIDCRHGDWFNPLGEAHFDLVLSNPPYLGAQDPHLQALDHEPREALVAAGDGLADLQTLAAQAPGHLRDGGWLLLEHGADQAPAVAAALDRAGFRDIAHRTDLAGHLRCTGGRWHLPR